jgi:hypothetical protein
VRRLIGRLRRVPLLLRRRWRAGRLIGRRRRVPLLLLLRRRVRRLIGRRRRVPLLKLLRTLWQLWFRHNCGILPDARRLAIRS